MLLDMKAQMYICTLAETGNYQEAAKKLYISQPNLSVFIKKLEETMGLQFFIRTQKKVELTYAGEILVNACRKMLNTELELEEALSLYKRGIKGTIRMGTYLRLTPFFLPRVMAKFYKSHPEIEIAVQEEDLNHLLIGLQNGALDLIVCNQSQVFKQFDYIPIKKDHLLVAVPPNHRKVTHVEKMDGFNYPYLDLRDLQGETFILQNAAQVIRSFTDQAFLYCDMTPQKIIHISNIETAVQLASEGLGIAFCMESYVENIRTLKPINFYMVGDLDTYSELNIVYKKGRLETDYFYELIQLIKQELLKNI